MRRTEPPPADATAGIVDQLDVKAAAVVEDPTRCATWS